jgi:hypothetical protein
MVAEYLLTGKLFAEESGNVSTAVDGDLTELLGRRAAALRYRGAPTSRNSTIWMMEKQK